MNINEYLQYNPETGVIIWNYKGKLAFPGKLAGSINKNGYIQIYLKGKQYYAHRLAWYLHYGKWPTKHVDHINGIRNDNRINNLRDVSASINLLNQKRHREKIIKCYSFNKKEKIWEVYQHKNNKKFHIGRFKSEELARQFVLDNVHLFRGDM
jgi:hypothetical protein